VDTDADLGEPVFSSTDTTSAAAAPLPSLKHALPDLPPLRPADALEAPITEMTTLANGVRVVSQETLRQCSTLCALVKVGSRYESDENAGVTHLLEQMAFRSTTTKSWGDMVGALESIGGVTSVAASREEIMYTVDVLREGAAEAMELLADAVARPRLLREELEESRQIVGYLLENGREAPQGLIMEEMTTVAFGGPSTSLGRPMFADPERTSADGDGGEGEGEGANPSFVPTVDHVRDFHEAHFVGENIVVSAAGLDHAEAVALAEAHFGSVPQRSPEAVRDATQALRAAATESVPYTGGARLISVENLPFTHVGIGFETGGWHDKDLVPACVLVAMLGGGDSFSAGGPGKGMYTRLYRKVLNQCAWVESILGISLIHNDAGCIGIVGSTDAQYAQSLLRVILDQMLWVATEPAEEEELDRARNRLKSSVLMNLESRIVLGDDMARQVSTYGKRENAEDVCRKIDAVTAEDVMRVAMRGLTSNPSVVAYGDLASIPDNIHELVNQMLQENIPEGSRAAAAE
jgi:processing peptidase subunit alpha